MSRLGALMMRERDCVASSPTAGVFIAVYGASAILLAFQLGSLFEIGQASLGALFQFLPWLNVLLVPALALRGWSEDRRSGAGELLLSLPLPVWQLVVARFLVSWLVAGAALVVTWPLWVALSFLGSVDHGATAVGYLGAWLSLGAALAVAGAVTVAVASPMSAFVLGALMVFVLTAAGLPVVTETISGLLGARAGEAAAAMSLLDNAQAAERGVLEARGVLSLLAILACGLIATTLLVEHRRAGAGA